MNVLRRLQGWLLNFPWGLCVVNALLAILYISLIWVLLLRGNQDTGADFHDSILAYAQVVLAILLAGIAAIESRRPILQGHIDRSDDRTQRDLSDVSEVWQSARPTFSILFGSNTVRSLDELVEFEMGLNLPKSARVRQSFVSACSTIASWMGRARSAQQTNRAMTRSVQAARRTPHFRRSHKLSRLRKLCVQAKSDVAADVKVLDLTPNLLTLVNRLHASLSLTWDEYARQRATALRRELNRIDGTLLFWSFVMFVSVFARRPFFEATFVHSCPAGFCVFDRWRSFFESVFIYLGADQSQLVYDTAYILVIASAPILLIGITVWQTQDINFLRPLPESLPDARLPGST